MKSYQMETIILKILMVLRESEHDVLEQVLNDLHDCLVMGKSVIESLEIIICSVKSPATTQQILQLLSVFQNITTSELIKKL